MPRTKKQKEKCLGQCLACLVNYSYYSPLFCYLFLTKTLESGSWLLICFCLLVKKLGLRESKKLALEHIALKWYNWNFNPVYAQLQNPYFSTEIKNISVWGLIFRMSTEKKCKHLLILEIYTQYLISLCVKLKWLINDFKKVTHILRESDRLNKIRNVLIVDDAGWWIVGDSVYESLCFCNCLKFAALELKAKFIWHLPKI